MSVKRLNSDFFVRTCYITFNNILITNRVTIYSKGQTGTLVNRKNRPQKVVFPRKKKIFTLDLSRIS